MKYTTKFFFLLSCCTALLCLSLTSAKAVEAITLKEAISKNLVKVVIRAADKDTINSRSSYYGQSIKMILTSTSSKTSSIRIENGYFLQPVDTSEQRMIITNEELITLNPKQKKTVNLYAMCSQMRRSSPGEQSQYALASKSDGALYDLIQLIDKKNYQSSAAQQAVWVLTDSSDIAHIYSSNDKELYDLQSFISKATGKPIPRLRNPLNYSTGAVNGAISWENTVAQTLTFYIQSENGTREVTFFENQNFTKPAVNTLTWKFSFKGFPKGIYYVILEDTKGTQVAKRPFSVK